MTVAHFDTLVVGTGLTGTDNTDGSITIDAIPFDAATATTWWMPLVDSDGTCVLDSGDTLIPTLISL